MKHKLFIFLMLILLFPSFSFAREKVDISITRPQNMPYFIGMPEVNIDAEEFSTLVLRIRSDRSGTARLFWASSYDPRMNEPKSIWFFIDKSKDFKDYVFNVRSQNPYWIGFIGQILVYPDNGIDGFEIDSASAAHGGILSNITSGWREFWGPGGRSIMGSTVNNMKASTLWGKSVNIYAYAIIALTAIIFFAWTFFITSDPGVSWQNCSKATILASIAVWGLLEASYLINQYNWLKSDLDRYDFKTLEEKQKISIGEDFYNYLNFCRQQLPGRAKVKIISSGPNESFYVTKGQYSLYPFDIFSKDPEYIITYYYSGDLRALQKEYPGFQVAKRYNEGAYILWKKKK